MSDQVEDQPQLAEQQHTEAELLDQAQALEQLLTAARESGAPVRMSKGSYSIYATPQGGMHIAYRVEGDTEDSHFPVMPAIVRAYIAKMRGDMGLGGITSLLTGMFKG